MTSALRWAATRAILMFRNCEGQSHKTVSTNHNFSRERTAEADSNQGPSAYQPNALPLGQTGSQSRQDFGNVWTNQWVEGNLLVLLLVACCCCSDSVAHFISKAILFVQLISVQNGTYALGKIHMRSIQSLRKFLF